jgi:hypothetical protein
MPQELELVYEVETGKPVYMHSVDASEACGLGDYTRMKPDGKDPAPDDLARAMAAAQGRNTTLHPEQMTPEQRAEARRVANAAATPVVAVPMGTPVVLAHGAAPEAPAPTMRAHDVHAKAEDKDDDKGHSRPSGSTGSRSH